MFGYICIANEDLNSEQLNRYKAYYCGICKSMGNFTKIGRAFLSYDLVFYALLTDHNDGCNIKTNRCNFSMRKKDFAIGEAIDYSGFINILLAAWKIRDNVNDDNAFYNALLCIMKKAEKIAAKNAASAAEICLEYMNKLHEFEQHECDSIDECADIFATMCGKICMQSPTVKGTEFDLILYNTAKSVARWVYIIDALDDYASDVKRGSYNAILCEIKSGKILINDVPCLIGGGLYRTLEDAYKSLDLLPQSVNKSILMNIISNGMLKTTRSILDKFSVLLKNGENSGSV